MVSISSSHLRPTLSAVGACALLLVTGTAKLLAQSRRPPEVAPAVAEERVVGPYDVHVLAGGPALTKPVPAGSHVLTAGGAYTLSLRVHTDGLPPSVLLAGVGDPQAENSHFLGISKGRAMLRYGAGNALVANSPLPRDGWHLLTATCDGIECHLYVDAAEVAHSQLASSSVAPQLVMAPVLKPGAAGSDREFPVHFGGDLVGVTLLPTFSSPEDVRQVAKMMPDPALLRFEQASQPWPVQTRGQAGYNAPQDPSLMPHGRAPLGKGVAKPLPPLASSPLISRGTANEWILRANWMLAAAPDVAAEPQAIATAGFDDKRWMRATVPGTVLTTMVDRGLYPDPD